MVEVKYNCPFGNTCEEIRDGAIHRCRGFVKMEGKNPQSEETYSEYRCSLLEWLPILLCENAQVGRGSAMAVEGLRNSMQRGYGAINELLIAAGTSARADKTLS